MVRVFICSYFENDGNQRAQFLIKELIEHSYKEGSDLVPYPEILHI